MTTSTQHGPVINSDGIEIDRLELSQLVGKYVKLYSPQFPGKVLKPKVISIQDGQIMISGGGETDATNNLVNNQIVVLQFPYKEQEITSNARLRRSAAGRCYLEFGCRVVPLSQRRFKRVYESRSVKLAAIPVRAFSRRSLAALRWVETQSLNFSSGGVMISLPSILERDATVLLNLGVVHELLPPLLLGQVRHCFQFEETGFRVGIEFLVREVLSKQLRPSVLDELPAATKDYTARKREKLNKDILAGKSLDQPVA
jgi:hypothetical protein